MFFFKVVLSAPDQCIQASMVHTLIQRTLWERYLLQTRYRKTSNIRRTLVGNKIVDQSDVVGASPVGAAPTTPSFLT